MEIKDLTVAGICNIIRSCAKSNVARIEMGDMKITFESQEVEGVVSPVHEFSGESVPNEPVEPLELSEGDREVLRELQDTQTMMDDPEQWESNMIDSFIQRGVVNEGHGRNEAQPVI